MSDDKTIVISTHQVRDIDKVLDHVLIMDNSRVLLDESTASICSKLFFLEVTTGSWLRLPCTRFPPYKAIS